MQSADSVRAKSDIQSQGLPSPDDDGRAGTSLPLHRHREILHYREKLYRQGLLSLPVPRRLARVTDGVFLLLNVICPFDYALVERCRITLFCFDKQQPQWLSSFTKTRHYLFLTTTSRFGAH